MSESIFQRQLLSSHPPPHMETSQTVAELNNRVKEVRLLKVIKPHFKRKVVYLYRKLKGI